ncbi:MAG: hypothetical protein AAFR81_14730 [Chloroflexota bacterium]
MNIFGIGGAELVLILLIMLIVAGPKRMLKWAYVIGTWVGKFRVMWEQVVDVMQKEVDAAGMDVEIPRELPTRQNLSRAAEQFVKPYSDELQKPFKEVTTAAGAALDEVNSAVQEAKDETERISKRVSSWDGSGSTTAVARRPVQQAENALADDTSTETEDATSEPAESNFGAWSNPQSPSQQMEKEV